MDINLPDTPILALIVPCHNEEELIIDTMNTLQDLIFDLAERKIICDNSFIVFVDDGSTDSTLPLLRLYKLSNQKVLKLTTNKGHQYALLAGLDFVRDKVDCVISIDADLQDDLRVIEEMINYYLSGFEIVCGVRSNRDTDNYFKKKSAKCFYWVMQRMGVPLIENHADFRLLSKRALIELSMYKEKNLFLRGILHLINLRMATVSYTQNRRVKGETKYNLKRMISLAVRGITSFSSVPIRLITIVGFLFFLLTVLLSIHVLIVYIKGDVIPGWASLSLPMYLLGGIQLLSLGVIGEYIAKIYSETKGRPFYHIEEIIE